MPAALRAITLAFAMMAIPFATATAQQAGPTAASANSGYRASASEDPLLKNSVANATRNTQGTAGTARRGHATGTGTSRR